MFLLCNYTEYGSDNGVSMKDFFNEKPYPGQDKIVDYLRHNGKPTCVQVRISSDRLTGERIPGEFSVTAMDDGEFSWWSDLAYHVEKYNMRLPKEFEDHVLKRK